MSDSEYVKLYEDSINYLYNFQNINEETIYWLEEIGRGVEGERYKSPSLSLEVLAYSLSNNIFNDGVFDIQKIPFAFEKREVKDDLFPVNILIILLAVLK
jgi:hypothetical protein